MIAGPAASALVNRLIAAIDLHVITISPLPPEPMLADHCLRELYLTCGDRLFTCLIDDEFGDADSGCAPLLLNLVLMEFAHYDDADDILAWACDHGLSPASPRVPKLWAILAENQRELRAIPGPDIRPVSNFDWNLNAGDSQILRALSDH